jgi:hypothetical protein
LLISSRWTQNLHETIADRHATDENKIQTHWDENHDKVVPHERLVLGETIGNQLDTNEVNEVAVKHGINDQEDTLLNAIPNEVDVVETLRNLQLGRNPDTKDTDVDESKNDRGYPSNLDSVSSIDHKEGNSVDDDSADTLNLYDP